jgi:predicted nucleic acid-binding Zn ribbon protein
MYCTFCGSKLRDGARFCEDCGTALVEKETLSAENSAEATGTITDASTNAERTANATSAPTDAEVEESMTESPIDIAREEEKEKRSTGILFLGILSLAITVSTEICGIAGIILGAIGLSKAKSFEADFGKLDGKANAGRILSRIGLIIGCILGPIFLLIGIGNLIRFINGDYPWTEFIEIYGSIY